MTHGDIKTKFMIEYDKADLTSSYPSLTPYEVETLLDKSYLALIAQKTIGNNVRNSILESDIKSISDLQKLIRTYSKDVTKDSTVASNVSRCSLPDDFLYFVTAKILPNVSITTEEVTEDVSNKGEGNHSIIYSGYSDEAASGYTIDVPALLALKLNGYHDFVITCPEGEEDNMNILQQGLGISFIDNDKVSIYEHDSIFLPYTITLQDLTKLENDDRISRIAIYEANVGDHYVYGPFTVSNIRVIATHTVSTYEYSDSNDYDPMDKVNRRTQYVLLVDHKSALKFFSSPHNMPWVKTPVLYIENDTAYIVYDSIDTLDKGVLSVTYIKQPNKFVGSSNDTEFECSDTVAEELISLAVTFALENVESTRLNSKINMRGLEA